MSVGAIIGKKYRVIEKIGEGCFGEVFGGVYIKKNEKVAIKIVNAATNILKHETRVLKYLQERGCEYIPIVHWYGVDKDWAYLVMTCYECSLDDFLKNISKTDSQNVLSQVMKSCIGILESVHKCFVIHRDIKPQNFMLRGRELVIIDFGISTYYIDEKGEKSYGGDGDETTHTIVGSPRYASFFMHSGFQCSRRDDLLSLGYMFLFLENGNLIWDEQYIEQIEIAEQMTHGILPVENINHCKNLVRKQLKSWEVLEKYCVKDTSIWNFLKYCYSLKKDETPKYLYLSKLF